MKYSTYFDWLSTVFMAGFFVLFVFNAPMPIYVFWAVAVVEARLKSIWYWQKENK